MELIILAGGMGSRFGGNKQTAFVDEHKGFLLDYSIYNAIKSGFNKVVFILNEQSYDEIKQKYSTCLNGLAKCEFVIQDDDAVLNKYGIARAKPLGTAYAILCLKDVIKENFCIINADDYYGKDSFKVASKFLSELDAQSTEFALVGYKLKNTLSKNGSVKRGICKVDQNGILTKITESLVEQKQDKIFAKDLQTGKEILANNTTLVSMNMFCFNLKVFDLLGKNFVDFSSDLTNLQNNEFLISTELQKLMNDNLISLKVLPTSDVWIGMTYQQDKPFVVSELKKLVNKGEFPQCVYKNFDK